MQDYIDFPCSETWLRWYHSIGLTPRNPSKEDVARELRELRKDIRQLTELLTELLAERRPYTKSSNHVRIMRVMENGNGSANS